MRLALVLACTAFAASCLSGGTPAGPVDAGVTEPFIALDHDFSAYDTWTSYDLGEVDLPAPHISGPCFVYVNHRAPVGATHYPVGTIIVKVTKPTADPATWQLFAMAKRGGGFNAAGAIGWEWFELDLTDAGPIIGWRGESPPPDSGYTSLIPDGGFMNNGCNDCHALLPERDYIADEDLAL